MRLPAWLSPQPHSACAPASSVAAPAGASPSDSSPCSLSPCWGVLSTTGCFLSSGCFIPFPLCSVRPTHLRSTPVSFLKYTHQTALFLSKNCIPFCSYKLANLVMDECLSLPGSTVNYKTLVAPALKTVSNIGGVHSILVKWVNNTCNLRGNIGIPMDCERSELLWLCSFVHIQKYLDFYKPFVQKHTCPLNCVQVKKLSF